MKREILNTLLVFLLLTAFSSCKTAQKTQISNLPRDLQGVAGDVQPLSAKETSRVAAGIYSGYYDWNEISVDGKVKMAGLPINPSAKVYMRRGKDVIISLRAPLVGEVGRIELDNDSLRAYNKLKKTYCVESVGRYLKDADATIADVQDLILARIFLLGSGTLAKSNATKIEISSHPSTGWIVTPKHQPSRAVYGYTVYPDGRLQLASVLSDDGVCEADAEYNYDKSDTEIDFSLKINSKKFALTLIYSSVNKKPKATEPLQINSKWERMSLAKLLKSF